MLDRNLSVYPLIQILSPPLIAHFCEILCLNNILQKWAFKGRLLIGKRPNWHTPDLSEQGDGLFYSR